jgi:hypothetical protein
MANEQNQRLTEEDGLFSAEDDEWIAAHVRQMIRAYRAKDAKAVDLAYLHFEHYLTKSILRRHLKRQDPLWDGTRRWFDGLEAEPEFPSLNRLRLRGEVTWVIGQEQWYYDPLEFELELCLTTGAFRGYVLRFGDHRPLIEKTLGSANGGMPVGRWAFTFERGCIKARAKGDMGKACLVC